MGVQIIVWQIYGKCDYFAVLDLLYHASDIMISVLKALDKIKDKKKMTDYTHDKVKKNLPKSY